MKDCTERITPGSSGYEAFVKDPSESKPWHELSEGEDMYADEDEELIQTIKS